MNSKFLGVYTYISVSGGKWKGQKAADLRDLTATTMVHMVPPLLPRSLLPSAENQKIPKCRAKILHGRFRKMPNEKELKKPKME